jgi:hypothetical protein
MTYSEQQRAHKSHDFFQKDMRGSHWEAREVQRRAEVSVCTSVEMPVPSPFVTDTATEKRSRNKHASSRARNHLKVLPSTLLPTATTRTVSQCCLPSPMCRSTICQKQGSPPHGLTIKVSLLNGLS